MYRPRASSRIAGAWAHVYLRSGDGGRFLSVASVSISRLLLCLQRVSISKVKGRRTLYQTRVVISSKLFKVGIVSLFAISKRL
jgi:hypothetical protein